MDANLRMAVSQLLTIVGYVFFTAIVLVIFFACLGFLSQLGRCRERKPRGRNH